MPAGLPAWTHGLPAWQEPPSLTAPEETDVCVVGLGGSGLRAVLELRDSGLDVVGIDAGPVAGQAAGRNGGLVLAGIAAFHHEAATLLGEDTAADWYRETLGEVGRMLAETPRWLRRTGSLRIAADAAELADCHVQLEAMRKAGLPAEPYDGPEGEGLLFPADAVMNPLGRCRELAARALQAGARLYSNTAATSIDSRLVTTAGGPVRCRAVLVAVDGGLADLLPELADDVRPLRLQMLGTAPTQEISVPRPVYRRYGFEYWQQLEDGRLLLGGFRDRGGAGEWGAPARAEGRVQELLEEFLRSGLGVKAEITHRWAAVVGYRPELLPFSGQVRPGVFAVGGYNGTGNVVGSLVARRAARLLSAAV